MQLCKKAIEPPVFCEGYFLKEYCPISQWEILKTLKKEKKSNKKSHNWLFPIYAYLFFSYLIHAISDLKDHIPSYILRTKTCLQEFISDSEVWTSSSLHFMQYLFHAHLMRHRSCIEQYCNIGKHIALQEIRF